MKNRAFGLNDIRHLLDECIQEFEALNQQRLLIELTNEMKRYRYAKNYTLHPLYQDDLLKLDFKISIKGYTPETDPYIENPIPLDYTTRGFMNSDRVIKTFPHIRRSIIYINCLPTLFENRTHHQIKQSLKTTIIHEFVHVIQAVNQDPYDYSVPYEDRFCEHEAEFVSRVQSFF